MSESGQPRSVILWHPDGERVALQAGELPSLPLASQENLVAQVQAAWNLPAWLLHDGGLLLLGQTGILRFQVLGEVLPAALSWGHADIPSLEGARRWQLPGWPAEAGGLLTGLGYSGRIKQISLHDLNTVLSVKTPDSTAYFKLGDSPAEARVTAHLAREMPRLLPPLLAANEAQHWQLLASGGVLLEEVGNLHPWTQALERLAHFQLTADAPALAGLGCPAYPLAEMSERILAFVSDTPTLQDWGLSPEKVAALQDALPKLRQVLTELQALELPDLPAHGDAHPRNALYGERGSVWFDWSECAAQVHPFMDAGWFLSFALHPAREKWAIRRHSNLQEELTKAYLSALGCPDAANILTRVLPLSLLHRATVYDGHFRHWQGTLPGWRPNYVPFYLREAVAELSRLN